MAILAQNMDMSILYLILTILTLSVALNLKLTFSLLNTMRNMAAEKDRPFIPPIGEIVPEVKAKRLGTGEIVVIPGSQQAAVCLFLSSTCPKCREKLPELEKLLPLLPVAGLSMWLVSQEPKWRLKRFLKNNQMASVAIFVNKQDYKILNPTQTSPFYLFTNHNAALEAGGLIGDENWQSFLEQMDEVASQTGVSE
jgi:AhpC/TSA family